jgi:hypothetical protein
VTDDDLCRGVRLTASIDRSTDRPIDHEKNRLLKHNEEQ